jgi:DNA polymerase III epsilon subunit-like protein
MPQLYLFDTDAKAPATKPFEAANAPPKRRRRFVVHTDLDDTTSKKFFALIKREAKKLDPNADIAMESTLANGPWANLPFLCVDTETTGLDRNTHRVIEVAWLLFQQQQVVFSDARLCSTGEPLPPEIVELTGISDTMLAGQPEFAAHADALIEAMSKAAFIVAYNAGFDKLFLEAEMRRIGKTMPDLPWIDPCVFIREIDRYQKGKKLVDAATRWGVEFKGAHRAMADAKATGLLLHKLAPHIKAQTLPELVKLQDAWQQDQERNFKAYLAKKQGQTIL